MIAFHQTIIRWRRWPLRWRLLMSALLSTVPLLLFGILLLGSWYGTRRANLLNNNLQLAELASAYVDGWVAGQLATLRALAGSRELQYGTVAEQQALVDRQVNIQPGWANLAVTDAQGQVIASSRRPFVYLGDREYFQQARRTGRPAVSNLLYGRIVHTWALVIAYPILRDGVFHGVVYASARPAEVQHAFSRIPAGSDTALALWDSDRRLIARTRTPESLLFRQYAGAIFTSVLSRRTGTIITDSPVNGHRSLVGYAPVPGTPWVATAATPTGTAFVPLYWATLLFSLLSLAVFAATLGWTLFSGNLVTRQIRALADSARAIGEGQFATRVDLHAGDELDDLAQSLNKMAADLAVVERLKADLLTLVSHELKTPLTAIRSALDLLSTGLITPDTPRYAEVLGIADRQARRLGGLIDNLISIGRVEAGHLAVMPRPVLLAPLVTTAVQSFLPAAQEHGLSLSAEVPATLKVLADPPRLTLVLNNLLDNAIKYTAQGSIKVQAHRENTHAVVTVTDTGDGLTAEVKAHLFEKFYQPEPLLTRAIGGAGIGLAVVKALVEAQGGRVFADSPGPGQGSTFGFTLPLAEQESS